MAINKVSNASRQAIRDKTVKDIPDRPSERGYSAEELKSLFSEAIYGTNNSALAEIDRVVEEINAYIGDLDGSATIKTYVQNYVIGQLVSVAPITALSFSNGVITYTKYHNNTPTTGTVDITPSSAVFWNENKLTDKSGNVKYPETIVDRINDNVNNKTLREILNKLASDISTLDGKHDTDYTNIQNQLAAILGGNAPAALDTIKELAQALKNDPDTIDDILQSLSSLDSGKVDKVSGKGLSENDFTNSLKSSLEGLLARNLVDAEDLPTDLSDFNDDSTHRLVTDEEKDAWDSKADGVHTHEISDVTGLQDALDGKSDSDHTHTYSDVGAEQEGVASSLVTTHNSSSTAHSDIREKITVLENKVNGRLTAISFDTIGHLQQWIAGTYSREDELTVSDLTLGMNIYIEDQDENDYWVSTVPVSSMSNLTVLPTDKVDLSDYVKYTELGATATSNSYNDLDNLPDLSGIATNADNIATNTQNIATNTANIALKQNHNLGNNEANKMLITDSNGNITTAAMGSAVTLIDNFNDANITTFAPTARLTYLLNNNKLDKQQGVENENKYLYVGNDGLIHLQNIKTKLSEFTNDGDGTTNSLFSTKKYVDDSIAAIPTPDVSGQISDHNTSATAHDDIRQLITGLSNSMPTKVSDLTNDSGFISSYIDTGATSVELKTGDTGNVVTAMSYDSSTRKITYEKGITALTSHQDISGKQDKTDNSLQTSSTTVVGAINEVNSLAKQSNKAKGFTNYSALITELNSASATAYNVGQSFYIQTLEVPDLWIISVESTSSSYTYSTDSAFITATSASGGQQVGYYKIAQLETQKVDLSNYSLKSATVSDVTYDSSDKKLKKTINGTTSDVVTFGANAFNSTNIPTSINGLSGGKLTSPLQISGGDATTAPKIALDHTASGQITDDGTGTLFGFLSNNATTLTVGGNSYALNLRGSGTRPQYKGNNLAMYSDIPTVTSTYSSSGTDAVNGTAVASALGSYLSKSGGTMTGDIDWSSSNTSAWLKPYLLAFKNADTSQSPTYPYTGFYQWGSEWQVNARDSNNTFVHNLLSINNSTKVATFPVRPQVNGTNVALTSDIPSAITSVEGLSGGTITGNTYIKGYFGITNSSNQTAASIDQNGDINARYVQGTWLYSSNATDNSSWTDVWVNSGGWLYKRSKSGIKSDLGVPSVWSGTQAQYDAISNKDSNTYYFIEEE